MPSETVVRAPETPTGPRFRYEEILAWEKENPELAAAWNEAGKEEQSRTLARLKAETIQHHSLKLKSGLVRHLQNCGCMSREATAAGAKPLLPEHLKLAEAVSGFAKSEKCFLVLWGAPGSGKTVAAARALTLARSPREVSVGYGYGEQVQVDGWDSSLGLKTTAFELSTSPMFRTGEDDTVFDAACKVCVLIIDDLGRERVDDKGWWQQRLEHLIDRRYGERLRTVVTSNLTPAEMEERYGLRIMDRMRQSGLSVCSGAKSLRGHFVDGDQ